MPVPRMYYTNFDHAIIEKYHVILEGWPLEKFCSPSEIVSRNEVSVVMASFESGTTRFRKLSPTEFEKWSEERFSATINAPHEPPVPDQSAPLPVSDSHASISNENTRVSTDRNLDPESENAPSSSENALPSSENVSPSSTSLPSESKRMLSCDNHLPIPRQHWGHFH